MERCRAIDNAKLLMIFLVVFGHFIEPLIEYNPIIKALYLSIYSVHMPVFIILSGMLSKNDLSESRIDKLVVGILIPFMAFEVIYEGTYFAVKGEASQFAVGFKPYWILWYLFSLFLWRMLLPTMLSFRYPITLSVVISVVAGYVNSVGYFLDIGRTLYFFPFFLIGYKLTPVFFSNTPLARVPKVLLISIVVLNVVLFWLIHGMSEQWLYGSVSYKGMDMQAWYTGLVRLGFYSVSIVTCLATLMIIPNTEYKISDYGKNSLYVYVWHGLIVELFIESDTIIELYKVLSMPVALGLLFAATLIITMLLSANAVANFTKRFVFAPTERILLRKNRVEQGI
ncbi:acyltransferase family protein [Microbulbifer variabilis]|uniref:acyltransferase family protein n=1 Tax=Microbulbifer variabilis TaxID=266805 RepID=UPI001CFC8E88|nr:acyltransferase family protein [Microbulbifer variabilis]